MISGIFRQVFDWRGLSIEVLYEPDWMPNAGRSLGAPLAHLQIIAVQPERAALPVSETGYKSCFIGAAHVADHGGPIAYARAWLEDAAGSPQWIAAVEESRQLALF